jgi:uncharacterized protein (TIRG00374 family)
MKRWVPLVLPVIGLGIFVWIIRGIGVGNVVDTFRGVDPRKLLIFPPFTAFILLMHGLRWQYLMRMIGVDYSLWRSTMVWAIGFFGASVTPAKVGDALRAYYLSQDTDRSFAESFLTVVIDRLLDVIVMLVFGVVAVFVFSYYYIHLPSVWIVIVGTAAIFVLIYLLLHRQLMKKLLGPFFRTLAPAKYREELSLHFNSFYDALAVYLRGWKRTSVGFVYTLLFWAAVALLAYMVVRILDIDVSLRYIILMLPMMALVEIIPISISGLGTREAAVIYFFSVVGIGSTKAVAFSLMYLFMGTYLVAFVGLVAWLAMPSRLRRKLKEET